MMKKIVTHLVLAIVVWIIGGFSLKSQGFYIEKSEEWITISPGIEIYPNPTSEYLNIKPVLFDGANSQVEIMDLSGHMVYHIDETFTELSIFVGNWKKGIYMVYFRHDKTESMHKVIVQ